MIAYILLLSLGIRFQLGWLWIAACICGIIVKTADTISDTAYLPRTK